jgi:hypothetical protein
MTIAEARCAAKFVVEIQIEEARLALTAMTTLDILLTRAESAVRIARWSVVVGPIRVAVACLAAVSSKVEMVRFAAVTLITADTLLALTSSLRVALQ